MNTITAQDMTYDGVRQRASLTVMVLVNILPLIGVLAFGWDVGALVILYWSENLVIGFYTLLKMLTKSPVGGLGMGLFFSIHYGGFCAVHGLFILSLMLNQDINTTPEPPWPLFLVFVQLLVNVVQQVIAYAPPQWIWVCAALFISHGVSFVMNYLLGGEREKLALNDLMLAPYGRIVVLHIAIIVGGIATQALGEPVAMLVVLVLMKIAFDVKLHLRQHRKFAIKGSTQDSAGDRAKKDPSVSASHAGKPHSRRSIRSRYRSR
tara:strand:+ start:23710 stop:24501 length:792 start_codon:yes stop_codon:yes gene_type:complete